MSDLSPCPLCGLPIASDAVYCIHCSRPVPDAITPELLTKIEDDHLPDLFYQYVLAVVGEEHERLPIIASLPIGLRAGYVLIVLDSEVRNGGFYQFFTNSSGRHADEALEYLNMIGAKRQAGIVSEAILQNQQLEAKYPSYGRRWDIPEPDVDETELAEFWSDVETSFRPAFDRLAEVYYELEDTESFWPLLVKFVRSNPETCVHQREAGPT